MKPVSSVVCFFPLYINWHHLITLRPPFKMMCARRVACITLRTTTTTFTHLHSCGRGRCRRRRLRHPERLSLSCFLSMTTTSAREDKDPLSDILNVRLGSRQWRSGRMPLLVLSLLMVMMVMGKRDRQRNRRRLKRCDGHIGHSE